MFELQLKGTQCSISRVGVDEKENWLYLFIKKWSKEETCGPVKCFYERGELQKCPRCSFQTNTTNPRPFFKEENKAAVLNKEL